MKTPVKKVKTNASMENKPSIIGNKPIIALPTPVKKVKTNASMENKPSIIGNKPIIALPTPVKKVKTNASMENKPSIITPIIALPTRVKKVKTIASLENKPSIIVNTPIIAIPELKQKAIKRKNVESNSPLNSEIKKKRRKRNKTGIRKKPNENEKDKKSNLPKVENLDFKKVLKVVKGLLSVLEGKRNGGNKELFGDETQKITLQVNSIKKPYCPTRLLRFTLPHPLYDELTEICLFVPDKKRVKKDVDKTVEYYTEMLEENKITNINKVLPLRAISTEYTQYEMRRKLANQFDIFLADGRVSHFITKRLGRMFAYTAKTPIPMNLSGKDWKLSIQKALAKTQMPISSFSDSTSVAVGTTSQSAKEIASNIKAVCQGLAKQFPGSWPNIRSLLLKTKGVPSLPIYMSIVSPNAICVPVMKSTKAPKDETVEGELSTMLDTTVEVKSDGTVIVHKPKRKTRNELSDAEDEEIIKEAMKHKKQSKTIREHEGEKVVDDDDDDERIIKETEKKLLRKLASGRTNSDSESEVEENNKDDEEKKQPGEKKLSEKKNMKQTNLKKKSPKYLEKIAKTNWIKSTKKGAKKLSKDQRKALIKVKKAEKNKK